MKLNRTGSNWNRLERNKINENWGIIEGSYNDVVGQITDEVVGHLIDSAKLIWKEPVDTVEDLPANAEVGETRMVREADPDGISYVYRYDGEKWEKIQAIDVTLVNEVDRRLSAQLADTDNKLSLTDWELQSKQRQAQPLVVIYSDDGRTDDNDLLDIAKNNNVPFCLSVIPERIVENNPNHYSVEQLKDFRDNYGFEILVHGYSHKRLGDMPYEEQEYEMRTAKE